jgi:hypothetical protein
MEALAIEGEGVEPYGLKIDNGHLNHVKDHSTKQKRRIIRKKRTLPV